MIGAEVVSESRPVATPAEDPPPLPPESDRATLAAPTTRSIADAFSATANEEAESEPEPLTRQSVEPAAAEAPGVVRPVADGDAWARVLRAQGIPTVLRTVLTYLRPVSVDVAGGRIVLAGAGRYVESARGRHGQIVEVCRRELGRAIEVVIQSDDQASEQGVGEVSEPGPGNRGVVDAADAGAGEETTGTRLIADEEPRIVKAAGGEPRGAEGAGTAGGAPIMPGDHPLVKEAMELFGARIVDVQHRRPRG